MCPRFGLTEPEDDYQAEPVVSMRITSPERRWRAASAPLLALWAGWAVSGSIHPGLRADTPPGLPWTARIIVCCAAVALGLGLAALVMRTHLAVGDEGLADHRMFRVVRVTWRQIEKFEIERPGALWGGFCVTAVCHDGTTVDLLSTRAYTRVPSARHVDELHRICWTLEEAARQRTI